MKAVIPMISSTVPVIKSTIDPLLVLLSGFKPGDAGRPAARSRAIESYLPLASHAARRYSGRGEPGSDLMQVAVVGLIKAIDRFDVGRGVPFAAYATPTILGEIKRYFRDSAWMVRIPRGMQELSARMGPVTESLAHGLRRTPSVAELAADLDVSKRDVLAARRSAYAYRPWSFDQTTSTPGSAPLADSLGATDPGYDAVINQEALRGCIAELPSRERRIIALRFFDGMTQMQIAEEVGLSQMQISRLLNRSLAQLRASLLGEVAPHEVAPAPEDAVPVA
jgi:RNA polymerase sigma-B factor